MLFDCIITIILSFSCPSSSPSLDPFVDIGSAVALLKSSNSNQDGKRSTSNLHSLSSDNTISVVESNLNVDSFRTLRGGIYIFTSDGIDARRFWVSYNDDSTEEIIFSESALDDHFMGQTDKGDLIFESMEKFDTTSLTLSSIPSTITDPYVYSVSGNFILLYTTEQGLLYQILDTVTNKRYNLGDACSPTMVALSETRAFLTDCSFDTPIFDMDTGERFETSTNNTFSYRSEHLSVETGAYMLSTYPCCGEYYKIWHMDSLGIATLVSENEFDPGPRACYSCGEENHVLFLSGSYFVVKELFQVSILDMETDEKSVILSDVNVLEISVENEIIYYLAEDVFGNPVVGTWDLTGNFGEVVDSEQEFDLFEAVVTQS